MLGAHHLLLMRYHIELKKSGRLLWLDDEGSSDIGIHALANTPDRTAPELRELLSTAERSSGGGFRSRGIPPTHLAHQIAQELEKVLPQIPPFSSESVIAVPEALATALDLPIRIMPVSEFISRFRVVPPTETPPSA
jgi:hypothetical protein